MSERARSERDQVDRLAKQLYRWRVGNNLADAPSDEVDQR
jgi:hypothetical protein